MLTAATATQSFVYGGLLLLAFGLGRTLPLFFAGFSAALVRRLHAVSRHAAGLEKALGVVFLALGGYDLYLAWTFVQALLAAS